MSKLDKLKASAKKEKAESVAADKALEVAKKEVTKKHIALKALCASDGMVKKGEEFTCSESEFAHFRKHKAV